jgi:lipopolysaccharide/colanic/teichoic acid biosynthesis glycosyltransferase
VGKDGQHFQFYKFRSMIEGAERQMPDLLVSNQSRDGVIFKMHADPRVTRVGRFIRKYSIDELPQLFNVLAGDMSLVGPRPPLPSEVCLYTIEDRKRLHVLPGITCFWLVSGRSNIPFKEQVELDKEYIRSQSLWLDFKILLRTIPAVFTGRGAY